MKNKLLGAVLAASMALPLAAGAQQMRSDWTGSGNVSLVSDYRFRSISQTYRLPAIQGGIDLAHSAGFYVGTWASNVSGNQFFGGNSMEWDFYGGYKFEIVRGWALDLGFIQYIYPGAKAQFQTPVAGKRYDTTEIYGGLIIGNFTAKLNYSVSDFFAAPDSSGAYYVDLTYNLPFGRGNNLQLHAGRQDVKNNRPLNYTDYKVGLSTEAAGLTLGVAYIGNNAKDLPYTVPSVSDNALKVVSKDTVVLSVGKTF